MQGQAVVVSVTVGLLIQVDALMVLLLQRETRSMSAHVHGQKPETSQRCAYPGARSS